jgi:hypothetical protein
MSIREKGALAEEIHRRQPHMLASCLVQSKLGVEPTAVEFLLNILLVSYQSMQQSGLHTTCSLPVSRRTGNSALPRLTMTAIIGPLLRHYRGRDPLQPCKEGAHSRMRSLITLSAISFRPSSRELCRPSFYSCANWVIGSGSQNGDRRVYLLVLSQ